MLKIVDDGLALALALALWLRGWGTTTPTVATPSSPSSSPSSCIAPRLANSPRLSARTVLVQTVPGLVGS